MNDLLIIKLLVTVLGNQSAIMGCLFDTTEDYDRRESINMALESTNTILESVLERYGSGGDKV